MASFPPCPHTLAMPSALPACSSIFHTLRFTGDTPCRCERRLGQVGAGSSSRADLPAISVLAGHSRGACSFSHGAWRCEHVGGRDDGSDGGRHSSCCWAYRTDYILLCLEPSAALPEALTWERCGRPGRQSLGRGHGKEHGAGPLLSPWPLGDAEPQKQVSLGTGPRGHQAGRGRVRGPRIASGQGQLEFIFGHVIKFLRSG